ncbi:MAG: hypothetical protein KJ600_06110 [Nanoarchaeota archaeon]|nr:hypothetical protein [Nanoarchaeota archaeon]MBU1104101.1 hypothetical protein [Nanoarchaeota archaeon]
MREKIIQHAKSSKQDFAAPKFSGGKLIAQGAEAVLVRRGWKSFYSAIEFVFYEETILDGLFCGNYRSDHWSAYEDSGGL